MSSAQVTRVALLGYGRMGKIHFRNLVKNPRVHLAYVVDEFPDPIRADLKLFGLNDTKSLTTAELSTIVLKDHSLDAVIICTPTDTHEFLVKSCLAAGKHVFVEKPLAFTVEHTQDCFKTARDHKRHLFVAFNRRFDPSFRKIHDAVKAGKIGKLMLSISSVRDHPEPKAETITAKGSGGIYVDVIVHNCDLLSWLTGEYPEEIAAMGNASPKYKAAGDLDSAGLMLKFPCGLIAYVDACRYTPYGYDQRFEIVGTTGALCAENLRDDNVVVKDPTGEKLTSIQYSFPERYAQSYLNEMEHFIDLVQGKAETEVTEEAVVNALRMAMAAETACRTKTIITE